MTSKQKKIAIIATTGIAVVGYYLYKRVQELKEIFLNLNITPVGLKNLKINTTQITFDTDLLIVNTTEKDLNINGYFAQLVRLNLFYDNKYIGTTKPVVSEIAIPSRNQLLFKNLPVIIPVTNIISAVLNFTNFNLDKLSVEAVFRVGGKEYYIKQ